MREGIAPLQYDPSNVFLADTGISREELSGLAAPLDAARGEALADLDLLRSGAPIPADKQPLDAAFIDLPERLLDEYRQSRDGSTLGRVLQTARDLAERVDRVVVLGIGGSYMGARALMQACCHPLHNELSRAQRGGKPRLYFAGNNVDNDATAALLDVLMAPTATSQRGEPFGLVVISKSGGTLETAVALRIFLRALHDACAGDAHRAARLVVPVTGQQGRLRALAEAQGWQPVLEIPEGVGGRFSVFTPVGLLPAALLGIDVVRLLEGAVHMNRRFRQAPPGDNPVLDYVGVCHLMEQQRGATIRVLSLWSDVLEPLGLWYDQLLSESLGKDERGATPLTVVNTRDLHSRGQQHQEGRRDKLITNVLVQQPRRDALPVGRRDHDQDGLNALADKTLVDIMAAAAAGTNQAYREARRPTADIRLQRVDEAALGQLMHMLMLATVVEGRLVGINPYGQPGVEAYKRNMQRILHGGT
jgi:glucose-6-phosphate isomerase